MADKTSIEWTDATWNPIRGCTRVSEGCRNCYAEGVAARFSDPGMPYDGLATRTSNGPRWTGKIAFAGQETLTQPLRWKRPRRIFVNSMSDLFHEGVPDEWIDRIFAVMALCPQHSFQVLTKRPERMRAYLATRDRDEAIGHAGWLIVETNGRVRAEQSAVLAGLVHGGGPHRLEANRHLPDHAHAWPLPNVWLGVSVEDQATANERVPILLDTPAAVRWISAEPLLGGIKFDAMPANLRDLTGKFNGDWFHALTGQAVWQSPPEPDDPQEFAKLDWIVIGGESGPGARPMHPDWARSIRDQCAAAGVAFLFKQWGEWIDWRQLGATAWRNTTPQRPSYQGPIIGTFHGGTLVCGDGGPWKTKHEGDAIFAGVGKKRAGRLLDGVEHDQFPVRKGTTP